MAKMQFEITIQEVLVFHYLINNDPLNQLSVAASPSLNDLVLAILFLTG